jgi:hypothetical protein
LYKIIVNFKATDLLGWDFLVSNADFLMKDFKILMRFQELKKALEKLQVNFTETPNNYNFNSKIQKSGKAPTNPLKSKKP